MDSFPFARTLKPERPSKLRYKNNNSSHLSKISNIFRAIEMLIVLALISRLPVNLQEASRNLAEHFNGIKLTISSPRFVFVLGNVIVAALFANSRGKVPKSDFYDDLVEKSERSKASFRKLKKPSEYEDKRVVTEKVRSYCRSRSEKIDSGKDDERPKKVELRRCETEKGAKGFGKLSMEGPFPEDSMSSDEFRRTVEAFIARQQRFLRNQDDFAK